MADLLDLLNQFLLSVTRYSLFGYAALNFLLLVLVCVNLKISRWMWVLMASLTGQIMVEGLYIFLYIFGNGTSMGFSYGTSYMGLTQLLGLLLQGLEVLGIGGLIISYRRRFLASASIDHSVWTQP